VNADYDDFCSGDAAEEAGDYTLARERFEQGARMGGYLCLSRLGHLFDSGRGAPVDKARAMSCWREAWRRGDATAAHNIAILYRERGDRRGSFRWFQRAAELGGADAQIELAKCYLNGVGVRRSVSSAIQCLTAALAMPDIQPWELDEAKLIIAQVGRSPGL
jgi:uncharacterized protein